MQFLALAVLLSACEAEGPQLQAGVAASYAVAGPDGITATGDLTSDGLLRVQLTAQLWNRRSRNCRFSPSSGSICDVTMAPLPQRKVSFVVSAGAVSAQTAQTDLNGLATVDLFAAAGQPITFTAESEELRDSMVLSLQFPFTQLRFGPITDVRVGDFVPRQSVWVQYLDPMGGSPEYAQQPPPVHFELTGCTAAVTIYGNDAPGWPGPTPWTRGFAFSFDGPASGCRWTASAPGFPTVTSDAFEVR